MKIVVGDADPIEIGVTEISPTVGIVDYSRRVTDDFGVTTVVERGFSRTMSVRFAVPTEQADGVQRLLADLRATAAQWIADDRFAWLSPTGFYKEFEVDLAVPPLSFCTLTVEGLAESGEAEDDGTDPAPEGSASSLRILRPLAITGAILTSSSVPETDHPVWSAGTTYPAGARVVRASTHRVYESLVAGNIGHTPEDSPIQWLDAGPTNRWAMFDEALGTVTSAAGSLAVILTPGVVRALALLDVTAETVRVRLSVDGVTEYDRTVAVSGGSMKFLDLPAVAGQVRVDVAGAGTVGVGTLVVGDLLGLGITEAAPTAGINDFSRKDVDDFGEVTVVERGWSKRMSVQALISTDAVDAVADRIAGVRARPALWIADDELDAITVYGFFRDFSIEVGDVVSKVALTVEGLSKAVPLAPLVDLSGLLLRVDEVEADLSRVTSDGYLGRAEKPGAQVDRSALLAALDALDLRYIALGSPADITEFRDAAVDQFDTLTAYLTGLDPSWTDAAQDTPIDPAIYRGQWVDAYAAVAMFQAAVTGRPGPPGASGITGLLTNESHTVAADASGAVASFAGAGGTFKVFAGTVDVTALATFSVVGIPSGISINIDAAGVYAPSAMSADAGSATLRASYAGATIDKVYSISKSRAGAGGGMGLDAKLLTIISDRQTIIFDGTGAPSPGVQTTTFTASKINTTATVNWSVTDLEGNALTPATSYLSAATGNSVNMSRTRFETALAVNGSKGVIVTATLSDGVTLTDKVSVVKVQGGADGSAGANGLNNATVRLYQRNNTGTPPARPASTTTYTFTSAILSGSLAGWSQEDPGRTSGKYLFGISAQAVSNTATDTITSGEWSSVALLQQDGENGRDAVVFWQDSTPGAPVLGDTWVTKTTPKVWQIWNGTAWVPLQGAIAAFDALNASYIVAGTIVASKFLLDSGVDLAAVVPGALNSAVSSTLGSAVNMPITLNSPNTGGPNGDGTYVIVTSPALTVSNSGDAIFINLAVTVTAGTARGRIDLERSTDGSTWTTVQEISSPSTSAVTATTFTLSIEDLNHSAGSLYFRIRAFQNAAQSLGDGTAGTNFTISAATLTVRRFFVK